MTKVGKKRNVKELLSVGRTQYILFNSLLKPYVHVLTKTGENPFRKFKHSVFLFCYRYESGRK